jgi:hypothetical protein
MTQQMFSFQKVLGDEQCLVKANNMSPRACLEVIMVAFEMMKKSLADQPACDCPYCTKAQHIASLVADSGGAFRVGDLQ